MKKIVALILSLAMIATMVSVTSFAIEQTEVSGNFNNATGSAYNMTTQDVATIGSVFSTVTTMKGCYFGCPSWSDNYGSLTVTLWKWDTDYATTTGKDPIAKNEFVDFEDNTYLGFEFETPLEAGVYYMELSDASDSVGSGVGVWTGGNYAGQAALVDGEYQKNLSLRMFVDYTEEVECMYGTLPAFRAVNTIGVDSELPSTDYIILKDVAEDLAYGTANSCEGSVNEDGNLVITVYSSEDPYFSVDFTSIAMEDEVECADYPVIAIRCRIVGTIPSSRSSELFMYTSSCAGATGGYSTSSEFANTNDWQTLVFDASGNATFKKNALDGDCWYGFRFDAVQSAPAEAFDVEIESISFFGTYEAAEKFDGDFSSLPTPTPTATPTATPEATPTPEPTATPNVTEAPAATAESEAEADATKAPSTSSGCGSVVVSSAAVIAVLAAGAVLVKRKRH